jgi:hypothetical protein
MRIVDMDGAMIEYYNVRVRQQMDADFLKFGER